MKLRAPLFVLLLSAGCAEDGHDHSEQEVITTVLLTFDDGAGNSTTFLWNDDDGDGGNAPVIDDIVLDAGTYSLNVGFENRLEDPAEDITAEIADENDEHQIFFAGTAVNGPTNEQTNAPLEHTYGDQDGNGWPVGLSNSVTAVTGTGSLQVVLQHLPELKTATLANDAKNGLETLPGESDVDVSFNVTIN